MEELLHFELTREFHDRFCEALEAGDDKFIKESLSEAKPEDVSSFLGEFTDEEVKSILTKLPVEQSAEIINFFEPDFRQELLRGFAPEEIVLYVDQLASDDAADILHELPTRKREEVLLGLNYELRAQVTELLRYEDDVAGGLMAKELIRVRANWTVVQCVEEIRKQAENVEKFYAVYVVDDDGKLLGRVSLRDLVLSDARKTVLEICETDIITVETVLSDKEVAAIMRKYDLESVPVVNVQGHLVGRITIDDVVDVITEQAEEERQLMAGITEDIEEDDSVWRNTRARLPWLLIGVVGGILNARFMGVFEDELTRIAAIAFFIPLIQATGGNVGIQSSSLIVQSLSNPGFMDGGLWKRLGKVFLVAVLNGLFLSILVFAANFIVFSETGLSFIVSVALFFVVVFASFTGTVTPLILNRLNFNPALASGPFITTTNDLLGLSVYFLTVHLLI